MQKYLNLSQQPYTNRRLFWICLFVILCVNLIFAFWTITQKAQVAADINQIHRQIDEKQRSIARIREQSKDVPVVIPQTVLTDEQKYQLASARQLIGQKSFSWNNLLSDIEKHVPKKVRLLSIKIAESSKQLEAGTIEIEIAAAGRSAAEMTEMMADIESSAGRFVVDQAEQSAISEDGDVPFTLRLKYRPRGGQ
jgi:Tfp pilus assembly protein PilN